ncbi:succinate dehydrogenase assembly factor 2 [Enterovirga aerilata]|uniref:FAD assembly factor SdhE n=1 Tax=Enterovirga aerilata TaxID=2730920 RepID=UPI003211E921
MAAPADSAGALDPRRKRALFRAWHRGTREMDLIMGRYADRAIGTMSDQELAAFEQLLDLPEADVFGWVSGTNEPPAGIDPGLIARLGEFRGFDQH